MFSNINNQGNGNNSITQIKSCCSEGLNSGNKSKMEKLSKTLKKTTVEKFNTFFLKILIRS